MIEPNADAREVHASNEPAGELDGPDGRGTGSSRADEEIDAISSEPIELIPAAVRSAGKSSTTSSGRQVRPDTSTGPPRTWRGVRATRVVDAAKFRQDANGEHGSRSNETGSSSIAAGKAAGDGSDDQESVVSEGLPHDVPNAFGRALRGSEGSDIALSFYRGARGFEVSGRARFVVTSR